jgi:subtilase family serine protease
MNLVALQEGSYRMFRIAILALFALASSSVAAAAAGSCAGPDPSLGSITVTGVTQDNGLNDYHITGTVTNAGSATQAKDVLQSVDIFMAGQKLDSKSIPPLAAGQSAQFTYVYQRSKDAGQGTTHLRFVLDMHNPGGTEQNCYYQDYTGEVQF